MPVGDREAGVGLHRGAVQRAHPRPRARISRSVTPSRIFARAAVLVTVKGPIREIGKVRVAAAGAGQGRWPAPEQARASELGQPLVCSWPFTPLGKNPPEFTDLGLR